MNLNQYTAEQLQNAREYAASFFLAVAKETDSECMKAHNLNTAEAIQRGERDRNLTVRQHMEAYLTGQRTAIL